MTSFLRSMSHRQRQAALVALSAIAVLAVLRWIDLAPRVESDFFFSPQDPQLRATNEIANRFPGAPQIIVRADGADGGSAEYESRLRQLTSDLAAVGGIIDVRSATSESPRGSPLWSRLLLNPDGTSTNLVLQTDGSAPEVLVPALQAVLRQAETDGFGVEMSGVPVIVELIRSSLFRDLVVFSSAAFLLFGLLIGVVYRRFQIVLGTLTACLLACSLSLIANRLAGLFIGLLTANIVTIVFVLTLSHIVFLTANARRFGDSEAVSRTLPASFWAMVTTLLGFLSLTIASARPLRELGMAGAIGTIVAIVVAYTVYPAFLRDLPRQATADGVEPPPAGRSLIPAIAMGLVAIAVGTGVPRVNTDPGLLTYFAPGTDLRDGLEAIDRDGGSSTLEIVVRDASGGRLDTDEANERMWSLQDSLEADPAVGVVVSPPVLFGHARQQPLARFLSLSLLADILESEVLDSVGLSFLSADRVEGRYFARMHEVDRSEAREDVVERLTSHARIQGLDPVLVGGVYELQGQLGKLIASSLRIGLGGLLLLFVLIAFVVSRSWRTTITMSLCLVAVPLVVLGSFGHLRLPIDLITSPAANVALALGVDSMIHLVLRMRALAAGGEPDPWGVAQRQMRRPILAASFIICAGFGIFALSTFPPTARFGLAVILGTITAAVVALFVLPSVSRRVRLAP